MKTEIKEESRKLNSDDKKHIAGFIAILLIGLYIFLSCESTPDIDHEIKYQNYPAIKGGVQLESKNIEIRLFDEISGDEVIELMKYYKKKSFYGQRGEIIFTIFNEGQKTNYAVIKISNGYEVKFINSPDKLFTHSKYINK